MAQPILTIGNKNYSSWSMRPWLVLKKAGIAFEEALTLLDQPDSAKNLARVSPFTSKVPALALGDLVIWDSLAIAEWAHEQAPHAGLWPKDPAARAQARAATAQMHSGFAGLRTALPMNLKRRRARTELPADCINDIAQIETLWAAMLGRWAPSGPFLFGSYCIADAFFTPVATRFRSYDIKLQARSANYVEALLADPDYQLWHAAALQESWSHRKTDDLDSM